MHIMRSALTKDSRQNILTDLISADRISSQAELVARLRKKGFAVTQASVSRDLEELRIEKHDGYYKLPIHDPADTAFGVVSLNASGDNLVVARCGSGLASALAVKIDALRLGKIVGTIAGDDTVFIAVESANAQTVVMRTLEKAFAG